VIDSKNISLETTIPTTAPPIIANRASMLLLIKHLLEGAVTFSPQGGFMRVKLIFGEFVDLEITDSGPLIQDFDQAKLFQRFKRARLGKRDSHGFGLALHLCKRIVDSHGGSITCRSQTNGTTFAVRLPISRSSQKQQHQEEGQLQG
jgi:signal transduction histidine kinase